MHRIFGKEYDSGGAKDATVLADLDIGLFAFYEMLIIFFFLVFA